MIPPMVCLYMTFAYHQLNKIKLVFDVSVPPDCPMSDDDIKAWIRAKIHNEDNKYVAIVNTDRFFF